MESAPAQQYGENNDRNQASADWISIRWTVAVYDNPFIVACVDVTNAHYITHYVVSYSFATFFIVETDAFVR